MAKFSFYPGVSPVYDLVPDERFATVNDGALVGAVRAIANGANVYDVAGIGEDDGLTVAYLSGDRAVAEALLKALAKWPDDATLGRVRLG